MKAVFLSASVPDPARDPRYYRTGDVIRIRDAVDALVQTVLPQGILVWGGHPAISPFVRRMADRLRLADRVNTFQSEWFRGKQSADTDALPGVHWTPRGHDLRESLAIMRREMLATPEIAVGVFIGGMDGVEDEHAAFVSACPLGAALPVASTGGAAQILWARHPHADQAVQERLVEDLTYDLLFEDLVGPALA